MNDYVKQFLLRGLTFAGFGPIIAGFIYWMIDLSSADFSLAGWQVFIAIISTYILAFVQAGSSVFHQVEHWSPLKAALLHLTCIYFAYSGTYLMNSWIPFKWEVILIFTALFIATYGVIWLIIVLISKSVTKKLNNKLIKDN